MATITFGNTGTRPYGVLTVTETATSVANNTSTLSIKLVLKRPYAVASSQNKSATVTVNGTSYTWSGSINGVGDLVLINKTQTVTHNTDGSKTISLSASIKLDITWSGVSIGTISGSGTMALTNLQRYATVTQSLSAKTETTATMKWSSDLTIDYIWYSINDGSSWKGIDVADGKSGTYDITGLSANTTYQIKTRVRNKTSQLTTDSSALEVTTYSYPYANSMPNFTIGERLTLGIFNPLGRKVTINLLGADGSVCGTDTISGTSISGYVNSTVQGWLYASIPNSKSGKYSVKVTYGDQENTKTGGTYTVNENDCKPSISSVSYKDTKSSIVAITGNNQDIVKGQSVVQYTATGLTAQKSASVKSCSVKVNGNTYTLSVSGTSATGGNASIDSGANVEAVVTVTDSRGITASKTMTVTMLDLVQPSAIISLARQHNYYNATDITVDANYSSINGGNQITITYTATSENGNTTLGTLADNVQSTITLDNEQSWTVVVTLTDSFNQKTTYTMQVSRGMPIVFFDRLKSSVGVNCFPKGEKTLEVNGKNIELINSEEIATGTDFDDLTTTQHYYGNATGGQLVNCPITSGTFILEVVSAGNQGQLMQKVVACSKTNPISFKRFYYQSAWGDWISDNAYCVGETLSISDLMTSGVVTNAGKKLNFSITLPKSVKNVTVRCTTMNLNVWHADGGYTLTSSFVSGGYNVLTDSTITVTISKVLDNAITFSLDKSSAYNGTNNTPQVIDVEDMVLEFS